MRKALVVLVGLLSLGVSVVQAADDGWKKLPLTKDGKGDPAWVHIGYGGWIVDDGALRTDPAPEGLGLLVYKKEKLGNCQIRVVFKPKEARSNSGVYVRIDDGVLKQVNHPGAKYKRDANGKPTDETMKEMQASGERDEGPWYGVHHGYEVQIAAGGDPAHGTASIYSLADSAAKGAGTPDWHTMIITLDGPKIDVELDGQMRAVLIRLRRTCARARFGTNRSGPRKVTSACRRTTRRISCGSRKSVCGRCRGNEIDSSASSHRQV